MIPPPPTPTQSSAEKTDRTKVENVESLSQVSTTPTSTIVSQSMILSPTTLNTMKDNRTDQETPVTLPPNESESTKPISPSCLRPYRKVEDVTTVKRQPKTGWL